MTRRRCFFAVVVAAAIVVSCGSDLPVSQDVCATESCATKDSHAPEIAPDTAHDTEIPTPDTARMPDTHEDTSVDGHTRDADGTTVDTPDTTRVEDTTPTLQIQWTAPNVNTVFEVGTPVKLSVWVTAEHLALGDLEVTFTSSLDGPLGKVIPGETGLTSLQTTLATPGWHELHAQVIDGSGLVAFTSLVVGVCVYPGPESFDAEVAPAGWSFYGDATHVPEGWVELTGPKQGKQGAVFRVAEKLEAGDLHLGFSFRIGEGLNGGAHGLAFTVFNLPSVYELEATLAMAAGGGCLGYGVSGECGPMMVEAIHVEIDTYTNVGNPNTDPTDADHIAVLINGTMSPHVFWQPIPDINDGVWHTLEFILVGVHVTILLDGVSVIDGEAFQTFEFDGGFAGFSATTGLATDHHAVDDYWVKPNCAVP